MADTRIGWIGLGRMGAPMATNVLAAGLPLSVYNRTVEKAAPVVAKGAILAQSVAEVGHNSDVVFSMIQDDLALRDITLRPGGLLESMAPRSMLVDMSTVSPRASREVAAIARDRSIEYLRAPVSGSTVNAEAAILTILASGAKEAFDRACPLLERIGRNIFYVGDTEQARYLKLALNIIVGATASLIAEGLVLGEKGGVDWNTMIDIMKVSAIGSPLVNYKADALKRRDFTPAFTATQIAKDFDIALDVAKEVQAPLQITSLVRQHFTAMQSSGRSEWDLFGYVDLLEEIAGLKHSQTTN